MSYATEGTAIRSRFNTAWGATTPIAWPNVNFTPPSGEPWVRFSVKTSDADEIGMNSGGTRRYRHEGMVAIQVFTPSNEGPGEALTLAEQVCAIFRGVVADGIRYGAPYVTEAGIDSAGWYQVNAWCPFYRDSLY